MPDSSAPLARNLRALAAMHSFRSTDVCGRVVVCAARSLAGDARVADALRRSGLDFRPARSPAAVMAGLFDASTAVLLVEAGGPAVDLAGLLRRRRELACATPVLVVLDPAGAPGHREAFELGADDCVSSPVRVTELVARVERLARRAPDAARPDGAVLELGAARVDLARHVAWRGERRFALPARAFQLLEVLARGRGRVVSRDALIDALWGPGADVNHRTIDNLVLHLRQLIEAGPGEPRLLRSVHGVGYRLELREVARCVSA